MLRCARCDMGGNMAKKAGRDGKRREKRQRWKTSRPNSTPKWAYSPSLRSALGAPLEVPFDRDWFDAANQKLMTLHKRYDDGDRSALLDGVEVILHTFAPDWIRERFCNAWADYRQYA